MMTEEKPQLSPDPELTTLISLQGRRGTVDVILKLPSALDYINYQIKAIAPGSQNAVKGESFGDQAASEWLIQKCYRVISVDVLEALGAIAPLPTSNEPQQGFGKTEEGEVEEEPPQPLPGRALTPGLLEDLQVEADEYGALLRAIVGIEGEVTYNDLSEEDVELGKGIKESNDFTYEGRRIQRLFISWTQTLKIQKALMRQQRQAFIDLFTKYFTIDGNPITLEMLKDPDPRTGVGVKAGILIYVRLGEYLNK